MPTNMGANVVVKPDMFMRVLIESALKMTGKSKANSKAPHFAVHFGNSVEDAIMVLRQIQQTHAGREFLKDNT